MAWSRVYRIYYDKSRRLSLHNSRRKALYLSTYRIAIPLYITAAPLLYSPYLVVLPSCLALFSVPAIVAIASPVAQAWAVNMVLIS